MTAKAARKIIRKYAAWVFNPARPVPAWLDKLYRKATKAALQG